MSVQRFFGVNNRDAMAKVRAKLGKDALVLANRPGQSGVEIIAMAESDLEQLAEGNIDSEQLGKRLMTEVAAIRSQLHQHHSSDQLSNREQWWTRLRHLGIGRELGELLLSSLPEDADDQWLSDQLQSRLAIGQPESLAGNGRILALVGPTGVGKTTTVAKLAARFVKAHGHHQLALVSIDNFRIGAHDQLRIYADKLGVDIHLLDATRSLGDISWALRKKKLVLVDTIGLSQRDKRLPSQWKRLCDGPEVTPVLLLNAASQPNTLDEVVTNYRDSLQQAGVTLGDAIVSKEDEAVTPAATVDVLIRHQLRLHYVSCGQAVPRDIRPANSTDIISKMLASSSQTPLIDEPIPMLASELLGQGRALGGALAVMRQQVQGFDWLEKLWSWRQLPAAEQHSYLRDELPAQRQKTAGVYWHGGGEQPYHLYGLDRHGLPLVAACEHLRAGELHHSYQRVDRRFGGDVQLLHQLPDAATWRQLVNRKQRWASRCQADYPVWFNGEKLTLGETALNAVGRGCVTLRYNDQTVTVVLRSQQVSCRLGEGSVSAMLDAWFADLRHSDSGELVAQRYWLLPRGLKSAFASSLVLAQLRNEALPWLASHARKLIVAQAAARPGQVSSRLANGLAVLACRLYAQDTEWTLNLRRKLFYLSGAEDGNSAVSLLEALVTLLSTSDALRELQVSA